MHVTKGSGNCVHLFLGLFRATSTLISAVHLVTLPCVYGWEFLLDLHARCYARQTDPALNNAKTIDTDSISFLTYEPTMAHLRRQNPSSMPPASPTGTTSLTITKATSTQAHQSSTSSSSELVSKSVSTTTVAGAAAAISVLLTIIVGLAVFCLLRRRKIRKLKQESIQAGIPPPQFKPFYRDPFGTGTCILSRVNSFS